MDFFERYLQLNSAFFYAYPLAFPVLVGLLGLLVGSFLNVVAYRLPLILERAWIEDSNYIQGIIQAGYSLIKPRPLEFEQALTSTLTSKSITPVTLSQPRSHCPQCKTQIKAWQNIPLVSFLLLKGRCAAVGCNAKIPLRYLIIELLTCLASFMVAKHFGMGLAAAGAVFMTWVLIALTLIDLDTQLLPDQIVLPLIWIGLIFNYFEIYTSLESAVLGAIAGYMSLWSIFHVFKLLTKKDGMGFGDFKLFAALGAWLGASALPPILMIASLLGSVIGLGLIALRSHNTQKPIAFGPYLAIAGWLVFLYGDKIESWLPFEGYFLLFN